MEDKEYPTATLEQSGDRITSPDIKLGSIDSRLEDKEYSTATLGQSSDRITSPKIQIGSIDSRLEDTEVKPVFNCNITIIR